MARKREPAALPGVADQYRALRAAAAGWQAADLQQELDGTLERMQLEFVSQTGLEGSQTHLFARATLTMERILLADLEHGVPAQRMACDIAQYVAFQHAHYRLLRAKLFRTEQAATYAVMFGDMGYAACGAVLMGDRPRAQWLCSEFTRHVAADFRCPYTLDQDFLGFVDWLSNRYLELAGRAPSAAVRPDAELGLYQPLISAFATASFGEGFIRTADSRIEATYRRLILDDQRVPSYYDQNFSALVPLELLAALRLAAPAARASVPAHPLIEPFLPILAVDGMPDHEFFSRAEPRLSEIETLSGLPASP